MKGRAAEWGNVNDSCGQHGWTEGAATPPPKADGSEKRHFVDCPWLEQILSCSFWER